jgi:hypothetical protein
VNYSLLLVFTRSLAAQYQQRAIIGRRNASHFDCLTSTWQLVPVELDHADQLLSLMSSLKGTTGRPDAALYSCIVG